MTEIEQRLREVLLTRADAADPTFDGPSLRRLAERRTRSRRRTGLQALAAAAAVVALAIGQQLLTGHDHRSAPTRVPAGHSSTATAPSRPPAPSSPPRPRATAPTPRPTRSPVRPTARPSASHVYVPPPPPRATAKPSGA